MLPSANGVGNNTGYLMMLERPGCYPRMHLAVISALMCLKHCSGEHLARVSHIMPVLFALSCVTANVCVTIKYLAHVGQ